MNSVFMAVILAAGPMGAAKQCPKTVKQLMTPEPWSKMDQINLEMAKKRCPAKYKRSPCLKKFIRWEKLRYSAICGAKS